MRKYHDCFMNNIQLHALHADTQQVALDITVGVYVYVDETHGAFHRQPISQWSMPAKSTIVTLLRPFWQPQNWVVVFDSEKGGVVVFV